MPSAVNVVAASADSDTGPRRTVSAPNEMSGATADAEAEHKVGSEKCVGEMKECKECGKIFNVKDTVSFERHVCKPGTPPVQQLPQPQQTSPTPKQQQQQQQKSVGQQGQWPTVGGPAGSASAIPTFGKNQRGQQATVGQQRSSGAQAGAAGAGAVEGQQVAAASQQGQQLAPHNSASPPPSLGQQQFQTELLLLQGDERIRAQREALKHRLQMAGPTGAMQLEELECAVRIMLMSGRFHGTQGIPETMLVGYLPEKFLMPSSPFRTIAELSACLPWLLRVHQSMQWVQQMPNGLMTVQRLICPSASEMGGLAAPDGVLAVDWRMVDEVMARADAPREDIYRPGMAGDPRFPRGMLGAKDVKEGDASSADDDGGAKPPPLPTVPPPGSAMAIMASSEAPSAAGPQSSSETASSAMA